VRVTSFDYVFRKRILMCGVGEKGNNGTIWKLLCFLEAVIVGGEEKE
jgi:hypothetical protein